jgi:hypothetical protein
MSLRSTLSSLLSAPVAAALESRIRDLVDQALASRDLADPAAVRDLSIEVERARRTTEEARAEIARVREAIAALDDVGGSDELAIRVAGIASQDEALTSTIDHLQGRVQALGDLALELRRAVEEVERRAGVVPAAASPVVAESDAQVDPGVDRGCKVPGCTAKHRARGFCGRHYQMWTRGTLPGFVNADGTVAFEGDARKWQVDPTFAGASAERGARGLKIAGKKVVAQPIA